LTVSGDKDCDAGAPLFLPGPDKSLKLCETTNWQLAHWRRHTSCPECYGSLSHIFSGSRLAAGAILL